jgi:hypothetical protein
VRTLSFVATLLVLSAYTAELAAAAAVPAAPEAAAPSADAETELRAAIDILKTHHMNRDKLDWPAVEARSFAALYGQPESPIAAYSVIREIIAELREKHTFLLPAARYQALMADDPAVAETALPEAHAAGRATGILKIGAVWGSVEHDRAYVEAARRGVEQLEAQGVCRFVIDLRGNVGGNMWPMLNGVASLLSEPPYGYFVATGLTAAPWSFSVPWMALASEGVVAPPSADARADAPIAVLLDARTGSAGEFTAIAFEGRRRTMFFGEPTFGLVTTNQAFPLPDGARLIVSQGWSTDRTGRPYRVAVVPDRETASGQPTLDAAIAWLRTQPCHP